LTYPNGDKKDVYFSKNPENIYFEFHQPENEEIF